MRALGCIALALAGCSSILGIGDLSGPSGPGDAAGNDATDAPPDSGSIPSRIDITGPLQSVEPTQPPDNVEVQFIRLPQNVSEVSVLSGAGGAFTLNVPTNGVPVEGVIRAAQNSPLFFETNFFLPRPLFMNASQRIELHSQQTLQQRAAVCGVPFSGQGANGSLTVVAADGVTPVANARIEIEPAGIPGSVCYTDQNGNPIPTGSTGPTGTALIFGLPSDMVVTIRATMPPQVLGSMTLRTRLRSISFFQLHP